MMHPTVDIKTFFKPGTRVHLAGIGGLLNANFDQIMLLTNQMQNAQLRNFADVIDTYVYRVGLRDTRFSYAAAAGLFKAVINFLLLLAANKASEKFGDSAF